MNIPIFRKKIKSAVLILLYAITAVSLHAQQQGLTLTPAAGTYSATRYVEIQSETDVMYRFAGSSAETWIKYTRPLRLSALPGEERTFKLEVKTEGDNGEQITSYRYTIDKRAPEAPEIGTDEQNGRLQIEFSTPEKNSRIEYWLSSFEKMNFVPLNGEKLSVEPGTIVKAYSKDDAGNKSAISTRKIGGDLPCAADPKEIEVVSPLAGTFANAQWLVIPNADCFEWVRYSINGDNPGRNGSAYEEPVLINSSGQINLRIQAKPFHSDELHTRSIRYEVTEPAQDILNVYSPLEYGGEIDDLDYFPQPIERPGTELYYSLNDVPVTANHPQLRLPVRVKTTLGMRNYIPYRVGVYDVDDSTMHQYRYFFVFDRRVPSNPRILLHNGVPFSKSIRIEMHSSTEAAIYYTTDGSTPDRFSKRYTGPFTVESDESSKLGMIPVQAVARYENGNSSDVVRKLLSYDREVPRAPTYEIIKEDGTGADIRINHPDEETEIVYAIGYGERPLLQINSDSPVTARRLRVDFPTGYQGSAYLRFAARDKAGNLSSSTATAKINVDSVPPDPPVVKRTENTVSLEGEGRIFYRIKALHSDMREYSQEIRLEVEPGERKEYTIEYFARDEHGNQSVRKAEQFDIDKRIPSPPEFISSSEKTISNRPLRIRCIPSYPDALVYYQLYRFTEDGSIDEGSAAQLPDQDKEPGFYDSQYSQAIQLVGSENREVKYLLKARSYLPSADSWSETASAEFTIDKRPPVLPEMEEILGKGLFSQPVTLSRDEPAENQQTWIYIEEVEEDASESVQIELDKIIAEGTLLSRGAEVSGKADAERHYRALVAAVDSAGNSSISKAVEFTIDRESPQPPELRGLPAEPETGAPVEITAPADYREQILYELSSDGSTAPDPDENSPVLGSDPLVLEAEDSAAHTTSYSIAYRGIDRAGNMSPVRNALIRLSSKVPAPPEIDIARIGARRYILKIGTESENEVYVKLNDDEYEAVTREILFFRSQDSDAFEVSAYSRNSYGRKSKTVTRRLSTARSTQTLVQGVRDGGLYNENVTVSPIDTDIDVRYELAARNTDFTPLGPDSPSLFDSLSVEASRGQTQHYVLRVGVYDAQSNTVFSRKTYRFTIDKTNPLPPEIVGIQSGYHYTEDQTVRILSRDDAMVHYRISEGSKPEKSFIQYVQPEKIRVRDGTRKDISVEAWSEDQAGNQSPVVRREFVIDKESIYVAPDGKDSFSGGKENPFQSLDRALYEARTSRRNTIYLAAGEYEVSDPITIRNQLKLVGGLNKNSWQSAASGQSLLRIGPDFSSDRPLFSVRQGSLRIENLSLSNLDLENALCVQEGEYSSLIIRNSTLLHENRNAPTIVWAKSGNFMLNNSAVEVGAVRNGVIFRMEDTESVLRDSVITAPTAYGTLTLLDLKGGTIEISDSELTAEKGGSIRIINAENADIDIESASLFYGAGQMRSTGIRQSGGKLAVKNSRIGNGVRPAHIASGIELDNVNARLSGLDLEGNAILGLVQIRSKDSSLNINDSSLQNKRSREFSFLLRIYGGSCSVKDSDLTADSSYDVYGIELHEDAVALLQNSLLDLAGGERSTSGVSARGPAVCTVQESRLRVSDGPDSTSTAAVTQAESSADIKLVDNLFSGWNVLLESPGRSARSIEELEAEIPPFDQTNPHRDNRLE